MRTEKTISDKKKMILIILAVIVMILATAGGVHLHASSVQKKKAEAVVVSVMDHLQNGKTDEAEKILGKKVSKSLGTDSMDVDAYMKSVVSSLGYTSGDADTDAKASYTDLLKAGGADKTTRKNMKKLHDLLKDNVITSYEITGKDRKNSTVTVSADVKGIILLPKISFAGDVKKANQKLADYVNDNMDDLISTYNKAYADPNSNAANTINAALRKKEMSGLLPAMIRRVEKTEKSEETWTFTVNVSSDQAKIKSVSVSEQALQ